MNKSDGFKSLVIADMIQVIYTDLWDKYKNTIADLKLNKKFISLDIHMDIDKDCDSQHLDYKFSIFYRIPSFEITTRVMLASGEGTLTKNKEH